MNKIKEDAEFLRLGLVTGYIRPDEVIYWADELIQEYTAMRIFDINSSKRKTHEIFAIKFQQDNSGLMLKKEIKIIKQNQLKTKKVISISDQRLKNRSIFHLTCRLLP